MKPKVWGQSKYLHQAQNFIHKKMEFWKNNPPLPSGLEMTEYICRIVYNTKISWSYSHLFTLYYVQVGFTNVLIRLKPSGMNCILLSRPSLMSHQSTTFLNKLLFLYEPGLIIKSYDSWESRPSKRSWLFLKCILSLALSNSIHYLFVCLTVLVLILLNSRFGSSRKNKSSGQVDT